MAWEILSGMLSQILGGLSSSSMIFQVTRGSISEENLCLKNAQYSISLLSGFFIRNALPCLSSGYLRTLVGACTDVCSDLRAKNDSAPFIHSTRFQFCLRQEKIRNFMTTYRWLRWSLCYLPRNTPSLDNSHTNHEHVNAKGTSWTTDNWSSSLLCSVACEIPCPKLQPWLQMCRLTEASVVQPQLEPKKMHRDLLSGYFGDFDCFAYFV